MSQDETPIEKWLAVPQMVRKAYSDLPAEKRTKRPGPERMSGVETVHHIAEANIVAAAMMIAAFGKSGSTFDWSWLFPNMDWIGRIGYANVPAEHSLKVIEGLSELIGELASANPALLDNEITLFDSPESETYKKTVGEIMIQEAEHAALHLEELKGF